MGTACEDQAELAEARSNIYGLLAAVFQAVPDPILIATLRAADLARAVDDLGIAASDDFLPRMPDDQLIEDLAVEYTRLFIGPGPRISLYESVHANVGGKSEAALWSERTVMVKKFIESTGLVYADDFKELPDHVGAELEFMQRMGAREAAAIRANDMCEAEVFLQAQARFHRSHIARWVPKLCDAIIDRAELPFYRAIAEVTKAVIEFESERFEALEIDHAESGLCSSVECESTGSACS